MRAIPREQGYIGHTRLEWRNLAWTHSGATFCLQNPSVSLYTPGRQKSNFNIPHAPSPHTTALRCIWIFQKTIYHTAWSGQKWEIRGKYSERTLSNATSKINEERGLRTGLPRPNEAFTDDSPQSDMITIICFCTQWKGRKDEERGGNVDLERELWTVTGSSRELYEFVFFDHRTHRRRGLATQSRYVTRILSHVRVLCQEAKWLTTALWSKGIYHKPSLCFYSTYCM